MSQSRSVARARYSPFPTSSPLFPASTFTFLASWRGQLLVCTVLLFLGAVYFIVREPISSYRRHRREALSRAVGDELLSMTTDEKDDGKNAKEREKDKDRGREKKKDLKKRKGSLLRMAAGTPESALAGPSSIESSPTSSPHHIIVRKDSQPFPRAAPPIVIASPPSPESPLLAPTRQSPVSDEKPSPPASISQLGLAPQPSDVPLPGSPVAGPSRLKPVSYEVSRNGEDASDSDLSAEPESNEPKSNGRSSGFSVTPEEGYLPPSVTLPSGKKKKRKGKGVAPSLARLLSVESSKPVQDDSNSTPSSPDRRPLIVESPRTPSHHARKAGLTRPANVDLEVLLDERDRIIDSLRADIGQAKAEEGKAKEDAKRARTSEERSSRDVDRLRRTNHRTETEGRRRENELQTRLNQMSQQHNVVLHRLNALESFLRDSGSSMPSPSPIPGHNAAYGVSPALPSSSFGPQFAPSPSRSHLAYSSSSMYSSPMVHPNHPHQSPSPNLTNLDGSDLAGALSPGHLSTSSYVNGMYPDIGLGTMPLHSPSLRVPSPSPSRNGELSAVDLRRMSIESSVLKKKVLPKSGSESGESGSIRAGSEPLVVADENVEGLGFAVEDGDRKRVSSITSQPNGHSNSAEGSTSSSSHPTSPSPQPRRHILITPANADVFLRNGTQTPDSPALPFDLNGIKVVIDTEHGNTYFRDDQLLVKEASDVDERVHGDEVNGGGEERDFAEPVFASLAHTPAQVLQIAKMREDALKAQRAQRGRKRLGEGGPGLPREPPGDPKGATGTPGVTA